MEVIDFLGRGWKYDFSEEKGKKITKKIYPKKGKVCTSEGEDSIRESIALILSTARGERVMRPDFGCKLNEIMFAANSMSTATLARSYVEEALLNWEPRIEVLDVSVTPRPTEAIMDISIDYLIKTSNSKANLVYPFYLESVGK
jgi:uncharacterized protein